MTFSEWKKILRARLDDLADDEVDSAIEYYKEMFADMSDAGRSETDILSEFGDPEDCAEKIRRERGFVDEKPREQDEKIESDGSAKKKRGGVSAGEAIGLFFFSLIILLPIACTWLGVIVTFFALAVSGVAIAIAAVIGAVVSPAMFLFGLGGGEVLMLLGACVCLFGVGVLLAIGFWLATKYSVKGAVALTKLIYRRF